MSVTTQSINCDSKKYIRTSNGEVYEKPTFINYAAGTLTGYVAYKGVDSACTHLWRKAHNNTQRMSKCLNYYDEKTGGKFTKAVQDMVSSKKSELVRKNITIRDYGEPFTALETFFGDFNFVEAINSSDKTYTKYIKPEERMVKEIHKAYVEKYGPTDFNFGVDVLKYAEETEAWIQKNPKKYAKVKKAEAIVAELMDKDIKKYGCIPSPLERMKAEKPFIYKELMKSIRGTWQEVEIINDGKNALQLGNKVHVNMKKMAFALPHELGHAYNAKSKGLFKLTNKLYGTSKLALPIMLVALFRRKKVEGEESNTFVGKSLDFVKDNAVGLTVATQAPKLLEEGAASVKGIKMMKNYLNKQELTMMKKALGSAYGTYFTNAMIPILGVLAINLVRDFINKPQKVENPESVDKPFEQVA